MTFPGCISDTNCLSYVCKVVRNIEIHCPELSEDLIIETGAK